MQAEFNLVESPRVPTDAHVGQDKRSAQGLLTEAFSIAVDAASGKSGPGKSDSLPQSESSKSSWGVAEFASGFVKAVPLFMGPGRGTLLSAALYGLDEVHRGDDQVTQLTDFALGGVKGAANKLVMDKFGGSEMSMAGKGIAIGGGSSFIDSAFTRTNWIDQKTGETDIAGGLQKTAFQTAFGSAVGMAAFPLGHALSSKITPSMQRLVGGNLDNNIVAAVTTGGSFGFTSGVVSETASQIYSGTFDPLAIAKRGLLEGLSTSAAGGVGHRFSAQYAFTHSDNNSKGGQSNNASEKSGSVLDKLSPEQTARMGLTLAGGDMVGPEGAQHSVARPASPLSESARRAASRPEYLATAPHLRTLTRLEGVPSEVQSEGVQNSGALRREAIQPDAIVEAEIADAPGNEIFPPREEINGQPVPGRYSENGLWQPKQTLDGYTESQIKEATAHLADHYILGKPETMAAFRERLTPVLDNWHNNNTEVLQKVAAEEASLTLAIERSLSYDYISGKVVREVEDKVPEFLLKELKKSATKLRDFLLSPSATILGVTSAGERAEHVNDLIEARKQYSDDYNQTRALLDVRREQIQQVADQFTQEHGLSKVEIIVDEGAGPLGSYGNGKLRLQREYFTGRDNVGLAGTLYHELLHHEQYTLMVRRLADRMDIGREATEADRTDLKERYDIWLSKELPDNYMDDILASRNGERLTEQQAAAADILLDTTERHIKRDREAYQNSGNSFRKISSLLDKLNGANGLNVAIKLERDAADESNLLASINPQFSEVPVPKVMADAVSPEETRARIIDGLKDWQIDINLWRMYDYSEYRGRKLEWDAWLLTSLMQDSMEAKVQS